MLTIATIDATSASWRSQLDALRQQLSPQGNVVSERGRQKTVEVFGEPLTPVQVVQRICGDVQRDGFDAVASYTRQLDGVQLDVDSLRVTPAELSSAHAAADPDFLDSVRKIRENVLQFQTAILPQDVTVARDGVQLSQRYVPLRRVGICVPGGAAAYPSTVLMTAVPAQAAGVRQLAVVAPPTEFGANNPDMLAVCHELGIDEVYRVGGAQAVAALAYGVDHLTAVDKIVGPGNLFVALAKQHVYGQVDIDSIAGPSEVVILADDSARPDLVAADMLAQAEHAPGASILVTWDDDLLQQVQTALAAQVANLSRSDLTVHSLEEFGRLVRVVDDVQACEITDALAPEHLHIQTRNAQMLAKRLKNAGAIFVGEYSPVAMGDYVAGPSHVLPTGGTGRWASGLAAPAFLRSHSVIEYSSSGIELDAPHVQRLADKEGLTAHRASVDIRLKTSS